MLLFVVASWFTFAYNCLMAVYKTCCLQMSNCCLNFKWFKVFINCRVNLLNDCTNKKRLIWCLNLFDCCLRVFASCLIACSTVASVFNGCFNVFNACQLWEPAWYTSTFVFFQRGPRKQCDDFVRTMVAGLSEDPMVSHHVPRIVWNTLIKHELRLERS